MKRIIYAKDSGGIAVVIPAPECPLTLKEMAEQAVPTDVKYRIIEHTDLPASREFRNAWEGDFSSYDGVGA